MANLKDVDTQKIVERNQYLEGLISQYENEKREAEKLDFAWSGNLGHWYWNVPENIVRFNPLKITTLGYDENDIPENPNYQFFTEMLHPDDYKVTMQAMLDHLHGTAPVYETEYRIKTRDGRWKWYHDIGKITQRDAEGKPILMAGIVFDITEKRELLQMIEEKNKELEILSKTDDLTQLMNRREIISRLLEEISRNNRYCHSVSILLLDIDNFKQINDQYGHVRGDNVLREFGEFLQKEIREVDLAGRYGGEEFLLIFPCTDLAGAAKFGARLIDKINQKIFDNEIKITFSGGLAVYSGEDYTELLSKADKKLYEAKENGKNQIIA